MVITRFVFEWFAGINCIILRSQIPVLPLCWRVTVKLNFSTVKWYNLCLQFIQSQTCYPLIFIVVPIRYSAMTYDCFYLVHVVEWDITCIWCVWLVVICYKHWVYTQYVCYQIRERWRISASLDTIWGGGHDATAEREKNSRRENQVTCCQNFNFHVKFQRCNSKWKIFSLISYVL